MARHKGAVILFAMLALASQYAFAQLPIETRQLRLQGASSGQAVGFRLPLTPITNYNLTYPAAIGAGPGSFMFLQSVTNTSEGSFAWSNAPQATGWTPRWNATTSVIEWIDPDGEFNPNWSIRGNNFGTTTSRIFGTTSGAEIDIRTNNLNRMTIESDGDISINTTVTGGVTTTIGRTTDSHITAINGTTNIQGTTTINADNNTAVTNIGTGTTTGQVNIGATGNATAQTIAIGTEAGDKILGLGSASGASSTTIRSGTGNVTINSGAGVVNINESVNSATNINTGTSTGAVSIGNAAATNVTVLAVNASINNDGGAGVTNIGTGTTTGLVTIGGTGQQTISIGNGAGEKTVNLGSSNTGSTTNILGGTGNVNINVATASNTNINTTSGTSTVAIGNAASTLNVLGATNINTSTTPSGLTSIGSSQGNNYTKFSGQIQMEDSPGVAGDVLVSSGAINTPQWKNLNDAIGIRKIGRRASLSDALTDEVTGIVNFTNDDAIVITMEGSATAVVPTVTARTATSFTVTFSAAYTGAYNYMVIKSQP
ncbi:MAG: beta strand repeat-containing protein [Bacteroidota bacterium]